MPNIHPTAIVDSSAQIGDNVSIAAYCIVEAGVIIGDNCHLAEHVILRKGAKLGKNIKVESFAAISGNPQDLSFDTEISSGVTVGDNTIIREGVTIHRATCENKNTTVGESCFLMANSHIAHDCVIGSNVIMANGVLLGGLVQISDFIFLGGAAILHQFVRAGEGAMIGASSYFSMDIPPFVNAVDRNKVRGLNLIGLKRRGVDQKTIGDLKACYRAIYLSPGNFSDKANQAQENGLGQTEQGKLFLDFFKTGKRGFASTNNS